MLELDEWDELLTNGFTTLTHHEGLPSHDITNGYDNVDGAGPSEALSSHPLRDPSVGNDVGEIKTVTGATRPRLTHITRTLSEDDLGCPVAVEVANSPDEADTPDRHGSDDIIHTVCPSPHSAHIINHKTSACRFPLGTRLLQSLYDTVCRLQQSGMQISYGRQIQSTSVPNSSYLGIVRVVRSGRWFHQPHLCLLVKGMTLFGLHR
jgi:hypothetical protein